MKCTVSGKNYANWYLGEETSNTGDFAAVMDDDLTSLGTSCGAGQTLMVGLQGLAQGTYRVYFYATKPSFLSPIDSVAVAGFGQARLSGSAAPDTFEAGRNYTYVTIVVTGGATNNLLSLIDDSSGDSSICGIQVVPISLTGCSVSQQPQNIAAEKDQTISFTASVQGDVRGLQWLKNGQPLADVRGISGATTSTLTITEIRGSDDGAYSLRYTCGSLNYTTQPGTLTVDDTLPCPSDFNQDGGVDAADVEAFFELWESGC